MARAEENRYGSGCGFQNRVESMPVKSPPDVSDRGDGIQVGEDTHALHQHRIGPVEPSAPFGVRE
jgi:hypothetical protein